MPYFGRLGNHGKPKPPITHIRRSRRYETPTFRAEPISFLQSRPTILTIYFICHFLDLLWIELDITSLKHFFLEGFRLIHFSPF